MTSFFHEKNLADEINEIVTAQNALNILREFFPDVMHRRHEFVADIEKRINLRKDRVKELIEKGDVEWL